MTRSRSKQLDDDCRRIASGLVELGVQPGDRIVLMVRPGIEFIALTFALFQAGAVVVLIDPGMGRNHLLQCLEDVNPVGFVALADPPARPNRLPQAISCCKAQRHRRSALAWPLHAVGRSDAECDSQTRLRWIYAPDVSGDDPAAIIFTTGSTGPPKGVLYRHENFSTQVQQLQEFYQIQPGEIDLPGFPLFALFNSAMSVTTVIPDMDPRKPALVDPRRIVQAVNDWQVTQAFGSPAIWNVVGQHCEQHQIKLNSLRRILSAGAPVPPHVLQRMVNAMPEGGQMHTPYGATESLPVASIGSTEVLNATASQSAIGKGTCVGRRFSKIEWRVIRVDDGPIASIKDTEPLPPNVIGELVVKGPAITREYVTRTEVNALAKIPDGEDVWHRLGGRWLPGRRTEILVLRQKSTSPGDGQRHDVHHPSRSDHQSAPGHLP